MPPKSKVNVPGFEEALEELEALTERMEGEGLSLEELLKAYERGDELLRHCEKALAGAKKKIDLIQAREDGSNENSSGTESPEPETNDQDVRLF
ncbi:MAG: exodeoxyribonuclease VII small subunit [Verrucomicrobiales bacterium]